RERPRVVPKGHWRLAGGANHRLRTPNATSPERGDGMGSRDFRRPGRGSDSIFTTNPPRRANFHDASGVVINAVPGSDAAAVRPYRTDRLPRRGPGGTFFRGETGA